MTNKYFELAYDVNEKPFLVEKTFTRGEYLLLKAILKEEDEMEKVNHPSHYAEGRKHEPIDVIQDWNLDFCLGNTVKYISRFGRKDNSIEDLEKARFYLDYKLQELYRNREEFNKEEE